MLVSVLGDVRDASVPDLRHRPSGDVLPGERDGTSGRRPQTDQRFRELALPVKFNIESMNTFIDWNRDAPFAVERGEGECAV